VEKAYYKDQILSILPTKELIHKNTNTIMHIVIAGNIDRKNNFNGSS
jgi:hypothetical protein